MQGINLVNLLILDSVQRALDKYGQRHTLKVIKRVSIDKEVKKLYIKAFFQEVKRREN